MGAYGRCTVHAATLRGVEAVPVEVEVVVSQGLPRFSIVGMPDAAIQEARERVGAALRACGFQMPADKIIVNLAPGSLHKRGSGFDLPIALGLLAATRQINPNAIERFVAVGELSLDGFVRPVPGLLAYALCARDQGLDVLAAPDAAMPIEGVEQRFIRTLSDARTGEFPVMAKASLPGGRATLDYRDVAGHEAAKRALQIAATGGHGLIMMGPPGSGKTMLASRMPSILPPLTHDEMLQAAVVHSVAGEDIAGILAGERPFRSPHHSASLAGLIGGGSPPRPGEISLAHQGVLFLDELAEFRPSVLQGMRQPIELGRVVISRADGNVAFPSRFALVAASNPCPCGYFGDLEIPCTCTEHQVRQYRGRIGGPMLDRIDMRIDVRRIPPGQVLASGQGTSSSALREGVMQGREYASWRRERQGGFEGLQRTAAMLGACALSDVDRVFLEEVARKSAMNGRGIMRVLSVARTIADLAQQPHVERVHLLEALTLRMSEGDA